MKKKLKEVLPYIIIIIVVVLLRTFIITPARVDGESMEPVLHDREIVLLNKISLKTSEIERFDIVVIRINNELLVKRVIALPGEKIEYKDDKLFINDKEIETPIDFEHTLDFTKEVGENEYFVMGDNRNDSRDSRYFGSLPESKIKGKVNIVLFPFSKIGKVE